MAIRSMRSGASAIPEANVLQFLTDYCSQSGVANVTAGQLLVTANSALSVAVAAGRAYLLASGGNCYPVISDASATVSVNSNGSGNPRITSIVLYENLGNTPASDGSNTGTLVAVDGTAAPSPSAPSGGTIQSAVGAGNPFTVLCNVTVPSGASNLATQGTLVDVRTAAVFSLGGTSTMASQSSVTAAANTTTTFTPATGTVSITTTKTSNISIRGYFQVYGNPGSAWGESILMQLTLGGTGFGPTPQQFLTTGNPRFTVPIEAQLSAQAAGTYVFGLQFRSQNGTAAGVTIEAGYIDVVAI